MNTGNIMFVYVEPLPKGQWGPIDGYAVEYWDGVKVSHERFPSEKLAIREVRLRGYIALLATVRVTDKKDSSHWQPV
jgi:hypothetical protein